MRRLLGALGLAAALTGCGNSPLLRIADADYAPLRSGSNWVYAGASGGAGLTRQVVASLNYAGRQAFQIDSAASGLTSTAYVSVSGGELDVYSAGSGGWVTDRKLPYIIGNSWELPGNPGLPLLRSVEGVENVDTPAGMFTRCYRIKTEIDTYDSLSGLTVATGTLAWAAPNVGDVQYAAIDSAGTVSVTLKLASYSLGQ